jgi:hypothetical protein
MSQRLTPIWENNIKMDLKSVGKAWIGLILPREGARNRPF